MDLPKNEFKRRLQAGIQQVGVFAGLADPSTVEHLAWAGFDWLVIDTEHGPGDLADVMDRLRALKDTTTEPMVRVAWNDPVLVKRVLDTGAQTILFPAVSAAEEAAQAVRSTRYPPAGARGVSGQTRAGGYGLIGDYLRQADEQMCVVVQVETAGGLANLDAIAATPGVDAVFVGPSDLSAALGHLGDQVHPEAVAAVDGIFERLRALRVPAGYMSTNLADVRARLDAGVDFVAVATETSIMNLGLRALSATLGGSIGRVRSGGKNHG